MQKRKVEDSEKKVHEFNEMKDNFRYAIATMLAKIEAEANFAQGRVHSVIQVAQDKFKQTPDEPRTSFEEFDARLHFIHVAANQKFIGMAVPLGKNISGCLAKKIVIPKAFDKDITVWRKWRDDVTKGFDDEQEGMKIFRVKIRHPRDARVVRGRVCKKHFSTNRIITQMEVFISGDRKKRL